MIRFTECAACFRNDLKIIYVFPLKLIFQRKHENDEFTISIIVNRVQLNYIIGIYYFDIL